MVLVSAPAKADIFTFSFTGATGPAYDNVQGTITGVIIGLPSNGVDVSASDVFITSAPLAPNANPPLAPTELPGFPNAILNALIVNTDMTNPVEWVSPQENSFTVVNDVITSADFGACTQTTTYNSTTLLPLGSLCFGLTTQGSDLVEAFPDPVVIEFFELSTTESPEFTFIASGPSAVPEPGTGSLMAVAICTAALLRRGSRGRRAIRRG